MYVPHPFPIPIQVDVHARTHNSFLNPPASHCQFAPTSARERRGQNERTKVKKRNETNTSAPPTNQTQATRKGRRDQDQRRDSTDWMRDERPRPQTHTNTETNANEKGERSRSSAIPNPTTQCEQRQHENEIHVRTHDASFDSHFPTLAARRLAIREGRPIRSLGRFHARLAWLENEGGGE